MFIVLLTSKVTASNHTMYVSLSYQKCITQPILINLHPNEYGQEFQYYPFVMKLDRCAGSCNVLKDFSSKVCVLNKTKDLNLCVFNMNLKKNLKQQSIYHANVNVALMDENVIQINGGITINVDVSVRNVMYVKKIMFGILLYKVVKMENI